jgi:4-aminobutyrate aminotransferase
MKPDELLKRHKAVIPEWISLYYDEPMELSHGEGFKVWDSEGNEYLDFFGGIVTSISGHNIPEIVEAVRKQAGKILHSSTLYLIEHQVKLAEKLIVRGSESVLREQRERGERGGALVCNAASAVQ